MESDAVWSLQCGYISTYDGTRIDRCDKEIRQPGNVLRGWRGNCDAYTGGPYRATRRGVCMYEEVGTKVQNRQSARYSRTQILGKDRGQAWHQTRPRCSRSGSDLEIAKDGTSIDELPGFCELLQGVHQGLRGQVIPDATTDEAQRQELHVEQRGRRIIPENKEGVVRGTGARDANGKRNVRGGHCAMLEEDALHIGTEADVSAHVLDICGKKIQLRGLIDTGAVLSVIPIET